MTDFDVNAYQIALTFVILIISYFTIFMLGVRNKKDIFFITSIFLWHTFFSVVYFKFTSVQGGDALNYYSKSLTADFSSFKPAGLPTFIASIFTKYFEASYLNVTLIFGLIGTTGLILLYLSLKSFLIHLSKIWHLILFIPSMSFWSSGLGKDSISFCAICLFIYSIVSQKKIAFIFSVLIMFMVRPHIALTMSVSFILYYIVRSQIHLIFKLLTLPIMIFGAFILTSFVQSYVGIEEASIEGLGDYIDKRQGANLGGGSSLDISSMSYPMQMFTYIFRPLPFDAHNIVSGVTSIENTLILILFLFLFTKTSIKNLLMDTNLLLFIYFLFTCTILALTTANLGIATRQKWMFMPVVLYLLIYAYHDYSVKKNRAYV